MCTEVGQKKKKCSGGGAGQSGVHDYGFYGSNVASGFMCRYSKKTVSKGQISRQKSLSKSCIKLRRFGGIDKSIVNIIWLQLSRFWAPYLQCHS